MIWQWTNNEHKTKMKIIFALERQKHVPLQLRLSFALWLPVSQSVKSNTEHKSTEERRQPKTTSPVPAIGCDQCLQEQVLGA